jgi:hypothetical protein
MEKKWALPSVIFISIVASFTYYYIAVINTWWPISVVTLSEKGQFGDSFGLFTSLFSALAFGGVLFTLWYQHMTLQENKNDSDIRNFESILFNLLSAHSNIVQDMDIHNNSLQVSAKNILETIKEAKANISTLNSQQIIEQINKQVVEQIKKRDALPNRTLVATGRDCFYRYTVHHLKPAYKRIKSERPNGDELEMAKESFGIVWADHRQNLSHYLRFLYNIFKFIDEAAIPAQVKKKYTNIVRSQLSDYELLILFYNCLHQNGSERFKPLAEKYAIYNNLPDDLLLNPTHKHFYAPGAFL